jgi:hypothetical protein
VLSAKLKLNLVAHRLYAIRQAPFLYLSIFMLKPFAVSISTILCGLKMFPSVSLKLTFFM